MKNINEIKTRYMKEPFKRRLGHLASDIARIYSFLDNPANFDTLKDVIEESKYFIEWAAPDAPSNVQALFSSIQSKLALCHLHILNNRKDPAELEDLKASAKDWSQRLLEMSGLLAA